MFGTVVNKDMHKVAFVVLNEDKSPQYYELQDGETIIEEGWQIANDMNKPRWNGAEWIDTNPLPPVEEIPTPPTEVEVLRDELMVTNIYVTDLELKNLELEMRLETIEQKIL